MSERDIEWRSKLVATINKETERKREGRGKGAMNERLDARKYHKEKIASFLFALVRFAALSGAAVFVVVHVQFCIQATRRVDMFQHDIYMIFMPLLNFYWWIFSLSLFSFQVSKVNIWLNDFSLPHTPKLKLQMSSIIKFQILHLISRAQVESDRTWTFSRRKIKKSIHI